MPEKRKVLAREERREQLVHAAASVFSDKGYRAASVSDIIEEAGVARGTFYLYFESKKDLFLELVELYFSGFAQVLEENHKRLVEVLNARRDPIDAWRQNALDTLRYHSENPELTAVVYREAIGLDEHFARRVDELMRLARKRMMAGFKMMADEGLVIPCDLDVLVTMVNGATVNIINEYVLGVDGPDLAFLADELVRNQARALAPVPAVVDRTMGPPRKRTDAPERSRKGTGSRKQGRRAREE